MDSQVEAHKNHFLYMGSRLRLSSPTHELGPQPPHLYRDAQFSPSLEVTVHISGGARSLHKLKNAGAMWAVIDRWYPSRGENCAPGRGKAAFSWQCNIYPKRFLKRGGDWRGGSKFWLKHLFSITESILWTWLKDIWS